MYTIFKIRTTRADVVIKEYERLKNESICNEFKKSQILETFFDGFKKNVEDQKYINKIASLHG